MSEETRNEQREAGTHTRNPEKSERATLPLTSMTEAREALADLTNRFLRGEVTEGELRACVYSINGAVKALSHEKVEQIEKRLRALEDAAKGKR